jgi:predicted enzyme related to lactoylglutathione lyase
MAIARNPSFVLDCPDAAGLARFYAELLGWKIDPPAELTDAAPPEWAVIRGDGQCICFQQIEGYRRPEWPGQDVPQQLHLDVVVDDLDAAEQDVLAIGASKHEHQPGTTFRVFLDPAGHPFCLCQS